MATYAVKSEPFDNSDGEWPSMGICVSYNGKPIEIHVIDTSDDGDGDTATEAVKGLTDFIYDRLLGRGF